MFYNTVIYGNSTKIDELGNINATMFTESSGIDKDINTFINNISISKFILRQNKYKNKTLLVKRDKDIFMTRNLFELYNKWLMSKNNSIPAYVVYLLINEFDRVKIGMTGDVDKRIGLLERQGGSHIVKSYVYDAVMNSRQVEKLLHKYYGANRMLGEWYDFKGSNDVVIDTLLNKGFMEYNIKL